jgi:hypothetical protein
MLSMLNNLFEAPLTPNGETIYLLSKSSFSDIYEYVAHKHDAATKVIRVYLLDLQ